MILGNNITTKTKLDIDLTKDSMKIINCCGAGVSTLLRNIYSAIHTDKILLRVDWSLDEYIELRDKMPFYKQKTVIIDTIDYLEQCHSKELVYEEILRYLPYKEGSIELMGLETIKKDNLNFIISARHGSTHLKNVDFRYLCISRGVDSNDFAQELLNFGITKNVQIVKDIALKTVIELSKHQNSFVLYDKVNDTKQIFTTERKISYHKLTKDIEISIVKDKNEIGFHDKTGYLGHIKLEK